jgi:type III restriction enzyme
VVKRCITSVLSQTIIKGIQYEAIAGSIYELREMQEDGLKETDRFIDKLYEVKHKQKADFDYVPYDSDVERQFAELLDSREDIKLFMKLPPKFLIPTPVGDYNPDWAILKQEDGQQKIYMIRETKSTPVDELLRPTEVAKINCGKKHFAAIGIEDYAKASPEDWKL